MKQFIYSIIFIGTLSLTVNAQSGIKLTDYYHNPIQYNPAYVGVSNGYFVKGTYTSQWLGLMMDQSHKPWMYKGVFLITATQQGFLFLMMTLER